MQDQPTDSCRRRYLQVSAVTAAAATLSALVPKAAWGQSSYPTRTITLICPFPAGGTADITARSLANALGQELGQGVVVENRSGAGGMIGNAALAAAKPDGYTIGQSTITTTRFFHVGTFRQHPVDDFTFLARAHNQTFGTVVRSESPFKNIDELVAYAKQHPAKLTYATTGVGSTLHVGMEVFARAAGIELVHVPYRGGAPALQALMAGEVDILADSTSWAPHVRDGKMRLLATWGSKRVPAFGAPTLKEMGYAVDMDSPVGIAAPRGLPAEIEARLSAALRKVITGPAYKSTCDSIYAPVNYEDGATFRRYVATVLDQEEKLVRDLKLKELIGG